LYFAILNLLLDFLAKDAKLYQKYYNKLIV